MDGDDTLLQERSIATLLFRSLVGRLYCYLLLGRLSHTGWVLLTSYFVIWQALWVTMELLGTKISFVIPGLKHGL